MSAAAIHLQEPSVFVKLVSNHDKAVSESNVAVERRTLRLLHQLLLVWESVEEVVGSEAEAAVIWALFELEPGVCELPPPLHRSAPQLKSNDWMPDIPGQSVQ